MNDFTGVTDGAAILAAITARNTFLNASVPNPLRGLIPDGGTFDAATIQRRRLLTAFPQFGNVAVTEYNGTSELSISSISGRQTVYNRFIAQRFIYAIRANIEKTRYLNPQDTELTDSISVNERPHRFTFSSIYELPFGRKRSIRQRMESGR